MNSIPRNTEESLILSNDSSCVFTRQEAAQFLRICVSTLDKLDIPRTHIRRRVLYRRVDLEKWLSKQSKPREVAK